MLGKDKHEYFEAIASYDEDKLNEFNEWLQKNDFSKLHEEYVELGDGAGVHWEDTNSNAK
mgnify:CR=1 FL=1